jgi:hypothetical protein
MSSHKQYERPTIKTIPASRILEMMGPVSAGSSGVSVMPFDGTPLGYGGGGGDQTLSN